MSEKEIAVLLPCFNEAATIEKVVTDFQKAVPGAKIYVYDNNSTDGTGDVAARVGAAVVSEPKQGKGNVVRSMFSDIEADCYIMADGDDTYPAESAGKLAEIILNGEADMVIGDRLSSTYFQENKRPFHNFGNRLVRMLVNVIFASQLTDVMSGLRAFNRGFVKTFPAISDGFQVETEMAMHALNKGLRIREVPIEYRDRPQGSYSKLNTLRDGFKVLLMICWLTIKYRPALVFGLLAGIFAVIGIIGQKAGKVSLALIMLALAVVSFVLMYEKDFRLKKEKEAFRKEFERKNEKRIQD